MRKAFLKLLVLCGLAFFNWDSHAESFTTNIIDGFGTNLAGYFRVGQSGPFNFLSITNGGALTNTFGVLGEETNAHNNLAIVTGAGSFWRNSDFLYVGERG